MSLHNSMCKESPDECGHEDRWNAVPVLDRGSFQPEPSSTSRIMLPPSPAMIPARSTGNSGTRRVRATAAPKAAETTIAQTSTQVGSE